MCNRRFFHWVNVFLLRFFYHSYFEQGTQASATGLGLSYFEQSYHYVYSSIYFTKVAVYFQLFVGSALLCASLLQVTKRF